MMDRSDEAVARQAPPATALLQNYRTDPRAARGVSPASRMRLYNFHRAFRQGLEEGAAIGPGDNAVV